MKRLLLPLIGSKKLIQTDRILSFTCVMRYHMSSPKGKFRNLISSNSVAGAQLSAYCLANTNVCRFLTPLQLPTPELPKRLSIIFLRKQFSQRGAIPMVNPLLNIVCIFGRRWDAHSYLSSPKNSKGIDYFQNGLLSLF